MFGNADGKIELSLGGVVMLAMATLVATGIVFLLGVYVGKGITEDQLSAEQRVVRLPAPSEPQDGGEDRSLSFWDRLDDDEEDDASAPPKREPEPTPTEAPVRVAPPEAPTPTTAPTARPTPTERPAPPPTPTERAAAAPLPTTPPSLRGRYQVQVQALADRSAAERIVRDLQGRGYESRLSPAQVGGKTLYRVRVGPFANEAEARQAIDELKKRGFPEAFLAAGAD